MPNQNRAAVNLHNAMAQARRFVREQSGKSYELVLEPLRRMLRAEMERYGFTPTQALRSHLFVGMERADMTLWLAAAGEEVAALLPVAERLAS
jgi:hypothetical protein